MKKFYEKAKMYAKKVYEIVKKSLIAIIDFAKTLRVTFPGGSMDIFSNRYRPVISIRYPIIRFSDCCFSFKEVVIPIAQDVDLFQFRIENTRYFLIEMTILGFGMALEIASAE